MRPLLGTWPAIQACALTGHRTSDPLVHSLAHNPLSHTNQGKKFIFDKPFHPLLIILQYLSGLLHLFWEVFPHPALVTGPFLCTWSILSALSSALILSGWEPSKKCGPNEEDTFCGVWEKKLLRYGQERLGLVLMGPQVCDAPNKPFDNFTQLLSLSWAFNLEIFKTTKSSRLHQTGAKGRKSLITWMKEETKISVSHLPKTNMNLEAYHQNIWEGRIQDVSSKWVNGT